jgi:flagellar hook assembly protein FlgD
MARRLIRNRYLPRRDKLTIKIYDLTGKEVKTIISTQLLSRGDQQVIWDGTNNFGKEVSSGIYLYLIQTEHFSQTKKLLIIK